MQLIENFILIFARTLLGLYFIIPGVSKITGYGGTAEYMAAHDVPMISVLLPLTIFIQLVAGAALIVSYKGRVAGFILAGLTLVISVYMHNFWSMETGLERVHETQNFVKNMAIMAGLLMVSVQGTGNWSLSQTGERNELKG